MWNIDITDVKVAAEKATGMELSRSEELALYENELKKLRVGETGRKTPHPPRLRNHATEREIAEELDKAKITYDRNFPLMGETYDFVVPSTSSRSELGGGPSGLRGGLGGYPSRLRLKPPKVVVEALPFKTPNPGSLKLTAFMAADLKKKIKGIKIVLVLGGVTKVPEIVSKYRRAFDAVFAEAEIQKFLQYIRKYAK
jgi:hypothetical protein